MILRYLTKVIFVVDTTEFDYCTLTIARIKRTKEIWTDVLTMTVNSFNYKLACRHVTKEEDKTDELYAVLRFSIILPHIVFLLSPISEFQYLPCIFYSIDMSKIRFEGVC